MALVLSRADVVRHVDALQLLAEMRAAFTARARETREALAFEHARVEALAAPGVALGVVPSIPAFTTHANAADPEAIDLHDRQTGALLARLDAGYLTGLRTGVTAALATDALAHEEASRVALVGADTQGAVILKMIRLVRSLRTLSIYDVDPDRSLSLATRLYKELMLPSTAAGSVEDAVEGADIVILASAAKKPFLSPGMLKPRALVLALTNLAGQDGSAQLFASLIQQARFVCDDRELAVSKGAVGLAGLDKAVIDAELGDVLLRSSEADDTPFTVFASVGVPFQDLVAAWHVYEGARHDEDIERAELHH